MSDVYSDNLYNTNTIVCDNDIYSNNLRCNSFLSLSDKIIFNENLTLNFPFVTPKENQLGYQIIGINIDNNTNIPNNTLYTVSSLSTLTPGVWSIFSQISYKCSSITGSNPLITYNGFGISVNNSSFGNYRVESYSTQSNFIVNSTFSDQVVRIQNIGTTYNELNLNHTIIFQDCTLSIQSGTTFLVATRIA